MIKLPKPLEMYGDVERAELKLKVCEEEIAQGKEAVYGLCEVTFGNTLSEEELKGKKYMLGALIIERNRIYKKYGIEPLPF